MNKNFLTVLLISGLVSGCATARLDSGPSIALTHHMQAPNVGVSKVIDERQSPNIGTIGAAGIRVKQADLSQTLTNHLIQSLNSHLKVNVTPVVEVHDQNAASVAESSNTDRVVSLRVKKLKMFSADALMQPVEVNMDLELKVYDRAGKVIYTTPVTGSYEKRIGISIVEKSTGQLVNSTVQEAINNLIKDPGLKKSLASA